MGEPGCLLSGGPRDVSWHGTRPCWSLPAPCRCPGSALLCPHSPSGCTFWGKRPWSRTRRILWQLGMVLGAPVVISLAAGVAVPVITIGIPIYMGRKVLAGAPGVSVALLPAEPGSPWPSAWTDPQCFLLPTAYLCATPDHHQHSPVAPLTAHSPSSWDLLLLPSVGVLSLGGWQKEEEFQGSFPGAPVLWQQCCCGCPWARGGSGSLWLQLCQAGKRLCSWGSALCRALHLCVLSLRCWARAGGAACPGASSASLSPAVSCSLSLCPPS